jgi:hypothetical protein
MTTSWPPETLTVNAEEIINECELMEVCPERSAGRHFVPVSQMSQEGTDSYTEAFCLTKVILYFAGRSASSTTVYRGICAR